MFRRWWFLRLLPGAEAGAGAPRRRPSRERQQVVLDEWAAARERLRRLAGERVAVVGDVLRTAELPFPAAGLDPRGQAAYRWSLDAFEAAGRLLEDEHADLPDLAAAVVLAERALERLAAVHARLAGAPAPRRTERCFYNPLHGPAAAVAEPRRSTRRRAGRREAAAARRPACVSCRRAILAEQQPDVLPALLRVRVSRLHHTQVLVPYYSVPQQWSLWSVSACGAYGDEWPALVLSGEHRRRAAARGRA